MKQFRCFVALPVHLLQREQLDCIDWFAMLQMAFDPFVQEVVVFSHERLQQSVLFLSQLHITHLNMPLLVLWQVDLHY